MHFLPEFAFFVIVFITFVKCGLILNLGGTLGAFLPGERTSIRRQLGGNAMSTGLLGSLLKEGVNIGRMATRSATSLLGLDDLTQQDQMNMYARQDDVQSFPSEITVFHKFETPSADKKLLEVESRNINPINSNTNAINMVKSNIANKITEIGESQYTDMKNAMTNENLQSPNMYSNNMDYQLPMKYEDLQTIKKANIIILPEELKFGTQRKLLKPGKIVFQQKVLPFYDIDDVQSLFNPDKSATATAPPTVAMT